MIKYKTDGWNSLIERIEVERETDSSVWIKGRRCAKASSYNNYFDKWDQAKDYLLKGALRNRDNKRHQLDRADKELKKIKALTKL